MENSADKEFVPYGEASELKGLGFNEPCFKMSEHKKVCDEQSKPEGCQLHNLHCGYPDCTIDKSITPIPLPTFSQAFRWFDDNTECSGYIVPSIKEEHFDWLIRIDWEKEIECEEAYSSRIEAELACLRKLIEIVKEKQNEQI